MLAQLPPAMARDDDRLAYFLDGRPNGCRWRSSCAIPWDAEPVYELLNRHRAAYCVMSGAGLPCRLRATTGSCTSGCTARP